MNPNKPSPKIVIIAGPNGAGKTTFATDFLPNEAQCPDFLNADLIAAGLSPFRPDAAAMRAGRVLLQEIRERIKRKASFAFETTLSGKAYAQAIPEWRKAGYHVKLIFLSLPSVEMARLRVLARIAQGGHAIPESIIERRFNAGIEHFHSIYKPLVNAWVLYDNSGDEPRVLDEGENP
ncbi:MAG: zeta toxin family protein [Halothiobacillaceae bacterium]